MPAADPLPTAQPPAGGIPLAYQQLGWRTTTFIAAAAPTTHDIGTAPHAASPAPTEAYPETAATAPTTAESIANSGIIQAFERARTSGAGEHIDVPIPMTPTRAVSVHSSPSPRT
eukprot:1307663-Alexandrium_andersonii.AAC.1